MRPKYFLGLTLILCLSSMIFSNTPSVENPKVVYAERLSGSITIDGILDEPDWQRASPITGFTQFDPDEGSEATERTIVMVLYDDNALYIGAVLFDSEPDEIVGQLSRRDRYTHADRFEIFIDSNNDRLTAYGFSVNVSNVQRDRMLTHDGVRSDIVWDAVWESSTARIKRGWSVEIRIPFTALRFPRTDGEQIWRINFRRFIARKNESADWMFVSREDAGAQFEGIVVSRFGELRGIKDISPPLRLEVLPYVVARGMDRSPELPRFTRRDVTGNAGVDLKYGLGTDLTLDLTVNPDYGQVEVDQEIINLTAFETFYPEKRPFFLERRELFRFGSALDNTQLRLLYSRRIGRRPLRPRLDAGEEYLELPQFSTILGAAKLTGRTAGGFSIGVLSALTDKENALVRMVDGDVQSVPVAPQTSYNLLRIQQEVLQNSAIGMMLTTAMFEDRRPAYSGGVDWNFRFNESTYIVDGHIAGSRTLRGEDVMQGSAGKFYFARPRGKHWIGAFSYDYVSPEFDINDMGFIRRPDIHGGYFELYYLENFAGSPFRRYRFRWAAETRWNFDGYGLKNDTELQAYFDLRNYYEMFFSYQYSFPTYDDFETRGLGIYKRPVFHRFFTWFSTDMRHPIITYPAFTIFWNDNGWREYHLGFNLELRPSEAVTLHPSLNYIIIRNYEAWVNNISHNDLGLVSVFADRDIDQFDLSFRGIVTLHWNLSVQFFTQLLIARGTYEQFRLLESPDIFSDFAEYPEHPHYFNPDFNIQRFNANIVLRWEYMRGSTLYLVWTQGRSGFHTDTNQPFFDSFRDTFRTPRDNVFLLKLNYWFSL